MKLAAFAIAFFGYAGLSAPAMAAGKATGHAPIFIDVQTSVAGGQDLLGASATDLKQHAWADNGEQASPYDGRQNGYAAQRPASHDQASTPAPAAPVPEPSGAVMLICGLLLLTLARRNDDNVFKISDQGLKNS